uniref:Uncharacterized protein n=1 Tax=Romanomermis culicivorax TaxID=13658 RepID=A0A915JTM7_ROMCU
MIVGNLPRFLSNYKSCSLGENNHRQSATQQDIYDEKHDSIYPIGVLNNWLKNLEYFFLKIVSMTRKSSSGQYDAYFTPRWKCYPLLSKVNELGNLI